MCILGNKQTRRGTGAQYSRNRHSSIYNNGNPVANNSSTKRVLSAERLRLSELRNRISELTAQLARIQTENRSLLQQLQKQVTIHLYI